MILSLASAKRYELDFKVHKHIQASPYYWTVRIIILLRIIVQDNKSSSQMIYAFIYFQFNQFTNVCSFIITSYQHFCYFSFILIRRSLYLILVVILSLYFTENWVVMFNHLEYKLFNYLALLW